MRALPDPRGAVETAPNRNVAFAAALLEELARSGVRHVCLCPGSRSAPLAIALAQTPDLRAWTHVDERSAAYFALGLAKASRAPVALVCTSGTAAANFHPAAIEAYYARVPLLLLTADRPAELRDWGAPQTVDQVRLYGSHVRWFAEAPVPEPGDAMLRHARALACRAVAAATGDTPGPVHLNLPFREPLDLRVVDGDLRAATSREARNGRAPAPYLDRHRIETAPAPEDVATLVELVLGRERGVIACGPLDLAPDFADALAALAAASGWPVLAEPTAQLRSGSHVGAGPFVAHADLLLRDAEFAATHAPDVVLRFGPMPTSKAFRLWLERFVPEERIAVDPGAGFEDPSFLTSRLMRCDPIALCERVVRRLGAARAPRRGSAWTTGWLTADRAAEGVLSRGLEAATAPESAGLVRAIAAALPDGGLLYVANSMAVRDVDLFWPRGDKSLRVLCNRGANGIDGLVSSALGAAAVHAGPCVLLTGDLGFLHDVGALVAAHRHGIRLGVVVVNDDGGGIFSLLPIAEAGAAVDFERFFRVPHGLDLARIAAGFGATGLRVERPDTLEAALGQALADDGLALVEVPLDRARDVAARRRLESAVATAVARAPEAA